MYSAEHMLTIIMVIAVLSGSASFGEEAHRLRFLALDVGEGQAILLQWCNQAIPINTGHAGKAPDTDLLQRCPKQRF